MWRDFDLSDEMAVHPSDTASTPHDDVGPEPHAEALVAAGGVVLVALAGIVAIVFTLDDGDGFSLIQPRDSLSSPQSAREQPRGLTRDDVMKAAEVAALFAVPVSTVLHWGRTGGAAPQQARATRPVLPGRR